MQEPLLYINDVKNKIDNNRNIVFVYGNFNVLHAGHIRLLKFASENGDILVVGVNQDSQNTHIPIAQRFSMVSAVSFVDYVFAIDDLIKDVNLLMPNIIVMGSENEYKKNHQIEKYISKNNVRLIFSSGQSLLSSYEYLKKEFLNIQNNENFQVPKEFIDRKKINNDKLKDILSRFKQLKVCVLGDLIVDEYIICDPVGMSQEDPTIVITPNNHEMFIGGAGIVAAHAKNLGTNINFISVTGNDSSREYAIKKLEEYNMQYDLFLDKSRLTTLKQRFRAREKTLLRVNTFRDHHISKELTKNIIDKFQTLASDGLDLLVFSDFNYGLLNSELIEKIIDICESNKIMFVADSQSSSQVGDISKFKNAVLITPTEYEIRLALKDFDSGLVELARKMITKFKVKNIFITLGHDGVFIFTEEGLISSVGTDHIKAINNRPVDVSGAGDSMLILASLSLAAGANIWEASYLGSIASAIQVSRIGNKPLDINDLLKIIDS